LSLAVALELLKVVAGQTVSGLFFHTFIMAQNATEVKGANRTLRYG
jgi:hypothetical protein